MTRLLFTIAFLTVSTLPAQADVKKLAFFSISNKKPTVTGSFNVGGYSPAQVAALIARECKGKVGALEYQGKPRKRRRVPHQKFQTTCSGGLASRYKGSRATFSVSQQPNGKNMVETTTSDGNGNMLLMREFY
ncbi:hypothetical protein RXV86_04895 [Alisedimentitalea sp. MJ-SS2]|uniref:hypothetical protein n=1 Tax=Aliisedimentitalea sp. MJ-SS2 TaxID=3049795 RepID=UPI00290E12E1|nr:hypothetical protein [Alisedimentitalea sp. MJ-SS2]MDU8926718.1 hypothetical protein [Alisedimentitalea sp. MJ-SS2]